MKKQQSKSTPHILKAFYWSMKGIQSAFKHEIAFKQEIFFIVILLPFGLWYGRTATEKAILSSVLFIVLITELINSAIETAIDRISEEQHPLSGRAKEMGSAAVFFALFNAIIVWMIIIFDIFLSS